MSRSDKIARSSWRVQVRQNGLVTFESLFNFFETANNYYISLSVDGVKYLQVREAGKSRFRTIVESPQK